ncbi:hypothetical protein KEM55_002945 [Ascosphaera atra]|nr:hypothetical protein KEM55_002945 [Ascosphaera atra]
MTDELQHMIATITALNMSIRFIGGAIGFAIYYSVFQSKFVPKAIENVGGVMMEQLNITNQTVITEAIGLIAASQNQALHTLPGIGTNETAWAMVDRAAKVTFADSYVYVYYVSIAFGSLSIICACFLGNIRKHMDDHIAVVLR